MVEQYEIASVKISINNLSQADLARLEMFRSRSDHGADINITIKKESIKETHGNELYIRRNTSIAEFAGGKYGYIFYSDKKVPIAFIRSDSCWKGIDIEYSENNKIGNYSIIDRALGAAFSNIIIINGGLFVHSSAIHYKNEGIIFSAPSGTGKSTHTEFWRNSLNAGIINDDTPVLIPKNGGVLVCGNPWSGSTDLFDNVSVPLKAIVIISRHHQNEISEIGHTEIIHKLLPRCLFPYHNPRLVNKAFESFQKIIGLVPVYHLKCTPTLEAAKLVKSFLKL